MELESAGDLGNLDFDFSNLSSLREEAARNDFRLFCEFYLGLLVAPCHEEIIDALLNDPRHLLVIMPRGHGKSSIVSVAFPLWMAWRSSKPLEFLVCSGSEDQSKEILSRVKDYVRDISLLKYLRPPFSYDSVWSSLGVEFSNRSKMKCKPFGPGARCKHPNYVICDDVQKDNAADIEYAKNTFYSVIYPMGQGIGGKHLVVGTPMSFLDLLNDLAAPEKSGEWKVLKYAACKEDEDGNLTDPLFPELFSIEKLEKIRRSMPAHIWSKEYLCNPISGDNSLFPFDVIEGCRFDFEPESEPQHYLGCDIALSDKKGADYSAFKVVAKYENQPLKVVFSWRRKGISTDEQVKEIKRLNKRFRFLAVGIEKKGLSEGMVRDMQRDDELKHLVRDWNPTTDNKAAILGNLEVLMRNKQICFPPSLNNFDVLRNELMCFKYRTRNGKQVYEGVGAHDDTVIALAIAVDVAMGGFVPPSCETLVLDKPYVENQELSAFVV